MHLLLVISWVKIVHRIPQWEEPGVSPGEDSSSSSGMVVDDAALGVSGAEVTASVEVSVSLESGMDIEGGDMGSGIEGGDETMEGEG